MKLNTKTNMHTIASVALSKGIKLSLFQTIAAQVIQWLFAIEVEPEMRGRTTLLALWTIAEAMNHPGNWVAMPEHMRPHFKNASGKIEALALRRLLDIGNEHGTKFEMSSSGLRYIGPA